MRRGICFDDAGGVREVSNHRVTEGAETHRDGWRIWGLIIFLVVVSAGAVDVAVEEFFLGGFADFFDGDVEGEGDAGEFRVGVNGDLVAFDFGDGDVLYTCRCCSVVFAHSPWHTDNSP